MLIMITLIIIVDADYDDHCAHRRDASVSVCKYVQAQQFTRILTILLRIPMVR